MSTYKKKLTILKRSGKKVDIDLSKIRVVLDWACEGLDVNPIELEASIQTRFKNNITTKEIQKILLITSNELTSTEFPDWNYVSGRLYMFNLYKDVYYNRNSDTNSYQKNYYQFVKYMVKINKYSKILLEKYSERELRKMDNYINEEYDLDYTIAGAISMDKKYLIQSYGAPIELPQQMFLTIALMLHADETEFRLRKIKNTYKELSSKGLSLATPFLSNLRKPNGNLSSCFITMLDDNIEAINYNEEMLSLISKNGGGVGTYITPLRPSGSYMKDTPDASGSIMYWVRKINDIAVAVNQEGRRKGAITVGLDFWHKDILDFLEAQAENGDQRLKAYDIYPQIVINNLFLKRYVNGEDIWLIDHHEAKIKIGIKYDLIYKYGTDWEKDYLELEKYCESGKLKNCEKISASMMWELILEKMVETGKLYIANKDNMNLVNPNIHEGLIMQSNLCVESFSVIKPATNFKTEIIDNKVVRTNYPGETHVCNLISPNLSEILNNEIKLESVCRVAVRALDNSIELTKVPTPDGYMHNQKYRVIGIGALGLADWMAYNKYSYEKEADREEVQKLMEKMYYYCVDESIELAKERGAYPAYKGSRWSEGIILGKNRKELKEQSKTDLNWDTIFDKLAKYGIRNSQLSAVAPNTSTALLMGATASYLPVYKKFFYEENSNLTVPMTPKFIKNRFWYYKENVHMHQKHIIKLTSMMQKWNDTGLSMELVINPDIMNDITELSDSLIEFFDDGGKTVYYARIPNSDKANKDGGCVSCAN